jgi:hypothetical protein
VSAQAVDKLTRASQCSVKPYHIIGGGTALTTMTFKNDGGWCWTNGITTAANHTINAYYITVSKDNPPKHGHILIGDLPNSAVRIAYQPEPGFVGADAFTIHFGVIDGDVTFAVTVSQ